NIFSLQNCLLHWTINHIFNPRSGSLNLVNDHHLFFMSHIIRGIPINLLLFIFNVMKTIHHSNRLLPYGGLITKIFKHFNISLTLEKSIPLSSYDVLTAVSLHRMHWHKDADLGDWIRRGGVEPPPPPAPQAQESSFEDRVFAHFDSLATQLTHIAQTQDSQ